jgi:chromosome segregation ATPase
MHPQDMCFIDDRPRQSHIRCWLPVMPQDACDTKGSLHVQREREQCHQAVSLAEAVKAEAERRVCELQVRLDAASASAACLCEVQSQLDSTVWQLGQEKDLRGKAEVELLDLSGQLCAAVQERDALRDKQRQHAEQAAQSLTSQGNLSKALERAAASSQEDGERVALLMTQFADKEAQCAALTQKLTEAVSTIQDVRGLHRSSEEQQVALREAAAQARAAAADADARSVAANATVAEAVAAGSEHDELLQDFTVQVWTYLY